MAKTVTCTISPGGGITAEVTGVDGPGCQSDLSWLEKVGLVESEDTTEDFDKSPDLDVDESVNQSH